MRLYILDLDGTLYRGNEVLPYAVETVSELRRRGALIRFLTNNSGSTRNSYLEKLTRMGFAPLDLEIYSSGIGTARYCVEVGIKKVFAVGEAGLVRTLREGGLDVVNAGPDAIVFANTKDRAEAVVAGIHRSFTYPILNGALQQVVGGARLIATNADATYPVEDGRVQPGAGAIVASLEKCSGSEAFVVGKPNPFLIEMILRDANVGAEDCLVVGDRYETDIESGKRAGCETHLVLTGVTQTAPEGQRWSADLRGLL